MQFQFRRDVTVEGVSYKADEVVDESAIPTGSMESLLATWLMPYTPPAVEPVAEVIEEKVPAIEIPKAEQPISQKRKGK